LTQTKQGPAWLRRFHRDASDELTLVCFPHAGGSASTYLPISAALNPTVQVYAAQYPGRQDRLSEQPYTDIASLADQIVPVIRTTVGDRPYAFFGHSMGASLAFEVTRRMEREPGNPPSAPFASGRRAPSIPITEHIHLRDDTGLLDEVRRFDKASAQMLEDERVQKMVLPALRADYTANETYYRPADHQVRCPIVAICGDDDPVTEVAHAQVWQVHTTSEFWLKVLPGGHFYLTGQEEQVAAVLKDRLGVG